VVALTPPAGYWIFSMKSVDALGPRRGIPSAQVVDVKLLDKPESKALSVTWKDVAILTARLIFALVFIMAASFKFIGMSATADYIATAGFPFPLALAWLAAVFETALVLCFLSGAFFSEAALLAVVYVFFLGFAFHGPSHWAVNQDQFGFFVDHFTFMAGLLFAAAHGPGRFLAVNRGFIGKSSSW
jgi:putative oxidoreductase